MDVVGYADRLSVEPGEEIAFMVSCGSPQYRVDFLGLIHGDTNPAGPGFKARAIETAVPREHPGRQQALRPGSFVLVPHHDALDLRRAFTLQLWVFPTLFGGVQTLVSKTDGSGGGYALVLDPDGYVELRVARPRQRT